MHHLGSGHIVDAPGIGHPVRGGDGIKLSLYTNMWDVLVDVSCGLIGLLWRTGAAVDGGVDAPDGGVVVQTLQSHCILEFGPHAFVLHPQTGVHGFQDGSGLFTIGLGILADDFRNTGGELVTTVVIGRGMGHGTAAVIEGVAGPDAAIGVVEMVAVGIEVPLLPRQMRHDDGPHLLHIEGVGIVLEVPEQLVDIVQVHIVVVHLVVAFRIATDIAVGVHLRTPFLLGTGEVHLGILRRVGDGRLDFRHLTLGVGIEMTDGTVGPAEDITEITRTPACQGHTPTDAAV